MSVEHTVETTSGRRNAGVVSAVSGDSCTDPAVWRLSLVLAEIAASSAHRAENRTVLDAECEDEDERDVPDD